MSEFPKQDNDAFGRRCVRMSWSAGSGPFELRAPGKEGRLGTRAMAAVAVAEGRPAG